MNTFSEEVQNCLMKKLIYLSNGIIPSTSANSVHVMKMCSAFSKNIETILIGVAAESKSDPFDFYGTTNLFDLKLIKKYKGILGSFIYLFRMLALVAGEKEALFYGRHTIALFLLSKMNHKVAYESHQMPQNKFRSFIEGSMFRQKKFLRIVVISEALKKDYLRQFLFLKDEMVVVSHDAADLPMITADKNKNKKIVVGYVGHLYAGRGVELILGMAERRPSLIFELVGGQKEDVINWKQKSANLPDVVFRGHIQPKNLHSFYKRLDIVLAPYQIGVNQGDGKTDTTKWMSPMKIFEYMAFGLPIICSDIPVLGEILNKNNAILVSSSNLDAWCAALDELQNSRTRKILGVNAYKTVSANHTWEIRAKKILDKVLLEPTNQTSV